MCFGSSPSYTPAPAPEVTPAPAAAPLPSATPTETESQQTAADRRKRIAMVQRGMLSTIKTSPQGITGTGANLYSADNTGKKTTLGG